MQLKEVELFEPVKQWLIRQGYKVFCEIPFGIRTVDIVAIKEDEVLAVELKCLPNSKVRQQAQDNLRFADKCFVAVGKLPKPKFITGCNKEMLGVLFVRSNGVILLSDAPENKPLCIDTRTDIVRLCKRSSSTIGGLPCQKGIGPAQQCLKDVQIYQVEHPDATWKEIFSNTKNHYASPQSMRQSLQMLQHWQRIKKNNEGRTCGECERCRGFSVGGHELKKEGYCGAKGRNRKPTSKACINFIDRKKNL